MRLATREQSQKIDLVATREFGLTSEFLMENAGTAVAEEIHSAIREKKKKILVLAGPGNNGADAFVCARLLKRKGFLNVRVILVAKKASPSSTWVYQYEKSKNSNVEISEQNKNTLLFAISESDVIVDGIFGTGLKTPLSDDIREIAEFINSRNKSEKKSGKKIVFAIDVPSGLDVDRGFPCGGSGQSAIRADFTVTFGLAKPGFFIGQGPLFCGKIKIHQIGFPKELLQKESDTHFAFGRQAAKLLLPKRSLDSNKSRHGTVYVVAGSEDFPGAGVLTANAAGRAGAGYVYLCSRDRLYEHVLQAPEVIFRKIESVDFNAIKKDCAFVVGPGLGVNETTKNLILQLKKRKIQKVVLDADALTVCALEDLFPLPENWIITPHAGELSRILNLDPGVLEADRFSAVQLAVEKVGCGVLFKGFRSVVGCGSQKIVILSGNPALAKAGSGDILSGFIGAFMAQGLDSISAACVGAYVHGRIADEWLKEGKDVISLLPSDLAEIAPRIIRRIRGD